MRLNIWSCLVGGATGITMDRLSSVDRFVQRSAILLPTAALSPLLSLPSRLSLPWFAWASGSRSRSRSRSSMRRCCCCLLLAARIAAAAVAARWDYFSPYCSRVSWNRRAEGAVRPIFGGRTKKGEYSRNSYTEKTHAEARSKLNAQKETVNTHTHGEKLE